MDKVSGHNVSTGARRPIISISAFYYFIFWVGYGQNDPQHTTITGSKWWRPRSWWCYTDNNDDDVSVAVAVAVAAVDEA